jgi:chemotaxis protein MotA
MDFTAFIGLAVGLGCILVAQSMEGGNIGQLLQVTAAMIVVGGTVGAVIISFPQEELMNALQALKIVIDGNKNDNNEVIKEIIGFATKARKEGVITLEKEAKNVKDPIMKMGLEAVSDGADPSLVRELMETKLGQMEGKAMRASKVWEAAGAYSPTVGIIGAVLGLIQVMQNLSDPSKLGAGIAVAFVATIYGLLIANFIAIPIGTKIKVKSTASFLSKEIIIEGILSIQAGESPALIERKLQAFLLDDPESAQAGAVKEANA